MIAAATSHARFPDLFEQRQRDFGAGQRPTEVITLHLDACLGTQNIQLIAGFDALGCRCLAEADGKSNHRARQQARFIVGARQFIDEAAIDLDLVERELLQKTQR